ncbi:nSTAND3 domain-containing NTPase [Roseixanthobacter glucoisosaccharinicivorans]|uniref:nSTAND3 domain-containing NTPase n=1 Tax=Roseixanthobacter glucoisosaccharinicivorans TaxID=3119923 RepID=UPI00372B7874
MAVASDVLGLPVQTFFTSKDGGRDGAFIGTWDGAKPTERSTIQCKFTGKLGASLTLAQLRDELSKVGRLAKKGLSHDYIILTNAGVSGSAEEKIAEAFEKAGATKCRVFGGGWITEEIKKRPRLRMMVPRLYGLGDLSQIIDGRSYAQAKRILSSMGDDLACFVTTEAHRQSVRAINDHGFVLLLGDPASGKSTIGASLAIGALDDGAIGTIKVTSPEAFEQHWNPEEPNQFFWIDDAFGPTQIQGNLVNGWNSRLKLLRAAAKSGARILMTSRTYIWNSARHQLKAGDFPLFENSKVIIDVQGLQPVERAQILYNHVKRGDQPHAKRKALKEFLPAVSLNERFLPETARRLGSKFFTGDLEMSADGVEKFVEEPLVFLLDVLRGLDDGAQAAIALIFLHGAEGVPSPVQPSEALNTVLRLTGVAAPTVTRSLEALRGSLTLLVESEDGLRWTFKHPTIADAYARLIAESPEMVELYVLGAKAERLMAEIVCGNVQLQGASVHVPPILYDSLLARLTPLSTRARNLILFLTNRADRAFLVAYFQTFPQIEHLVVNIASDLWIDPETALFVRLHTEGLLPEATRLQVAAKIVELTIDNADGTVFGNSKVRSLLTDQEYNQLVARFRKEIVEVYADDPLKWERSVITSDKPGYLRQLKDGLELFCAEVEDDKTERRIQSAIQQLEERALDLEVEDEDNDSGLVSAPAQPADPEIASIFTDVDA